MFVTAVGWMCLLGEDGMCDTAVVEYNLYSFHQLYHTSRYYTVMFCAENQFECKLQSCIKNSQLAIKIDIFGLWNVGTNEHRYIEIGNWCV